MPQLINKIEELRKETERLHFIKIRKRIGLGVIGLAAVGLITFSYLFLRPTKQDRIIAERHRLAVNKADKLIDMADNCYRAVLADNIITKEEREELQTLLPLDPYNGLRIDEKRTIKLYDSNINIKNAILAELSFDDANTLLKKGSYNEANIKIDQALNRLQKEKKYHELNARIEDSIEKLAIANKNLEQITTDLEKKLCTRQELEAILASLPKLYDGLIIDEGTKKSVESSKNQINLVLSYYSGFDKIKQDIKEDKYNGDEEIRKDILKLASDLEKKTQPVFKVLLEEVKSYNYTKLVEVDAKYEKRLVKAGIPSEYKEEKKATPIKGLITALISPFAIVALPKDTIKALKDNWSEKETVKVKEGTDPTYEDLLVAPEHYQKIEINPYSGTQKVIEDNILIK